MNKKVILMILDGWGITQDPKVSAVFNANTSYIDSLYNKYANASLRTDGEHVGLPEGQMGNSEVGHMTIGSGRILYQDLVKINTTRKTYSQGERVEFYGDVFDESLNPLLLNYKIHQNRALGPF